jgi:acetyltransferase
VTIRNLDHLFDPRSVAVIGASTRPSSVGGTVWRNVRAGFPGARWAVNPKHASLQGEPCYASVAELPAAPDLAVICTPAPTVPGLIAALGRRGTRAAIVLTAGLDAATRQAMLDAARPHLLRILGPNCLGLLAPHAGLNASFSHIAAQPGSLAFVSQSGALATSILDWAASRGIGFSQVVSLGEHADIDFGDLLDWLASDVRTQAILLYIESVQAPRKFMSAARAAARNKPVLVVKAGRSPQGQAAAASHTGALAGSDLVYDAAIRRAGMLRVQTLQDLFVAAETLACHRGAVATPDPLAVGRLTLVTNGGGAGVLAADAAAQAGLDLVPLPPAVQAELDAVLPPNWSRANPVDIIGDAPVERYVQTLRALLATRETGTVLFMHAPTAIVPSADIARALVPVVQEARERVVSSWIGGASLQPARNTFHAAGIPHHDTPEAAVRAVEMLATYARNQAQLMEVPAARPATAAIDLAAVREIVDQVLACGGQWLTEPQAKALLAACGVPVVPTRVVPPEAAPAIEAAQAVGFPVVLKILSPQITHKSDVGGVALHLETPEQVHAAAEAMLARVRRLRPQAELQGFTVQAQVQRPRALELIVGASIDALFGPVILFGQGGTAVEVVADRAVALPPLNAPLARDLVQRTRVARLLAGWRDVPPADEAAVRGVLVAVSQLLADEPRIAEIDINPLLADADGVIALDARVRVSAAAPGGAAAFAVRPYPAELEQQLAWHGRTLTLRPIRPEDGAQHLAFFKRLDPADVRLRMFYSLRTLEPSQLARFTQIDYEREMALVATAADAAGQQETLAVARAICDPDNVEAEFAVTVRSDLQRSGLGRLLMQRLVDYLRARGTQRLVGTTMQENAGMLALARSLGFSVRPDPADPGAWRLELVLGAGASGRTSA